MDQRFYFHEFKVNKFICDGIDESCFKLFLLFLCVAKYYMLYFEFSVFNKVFHENFCKKKW